MRFWMNPNCQFLNSPLIEYKRLQVLKTFTTVTIEVNYTQLVCKGPDFRW